VVFCLFSAFAGAHWASYLQNILDNILDKSHYFVFDGYDFILPCAVTIRVKFGVTLIFSFNLFAILGEIIS
jgi:hypothetical protein